MLIECEKDPDDIIPVIGDRYFCICDDDYSDGSYNHPLHPHWLRIIDCEDESTIDVSSDFGIEATRDMAIAMVKLLNQDYKRVYGE